MHFFTVPVYLVLEGVVAVLTVNQNKGYITSLFQPKKGPEAQGACVCLSVILSLSVCSGGSRISQIEGIRPLVANFPDKLSENDINGAKRGNTSTHQNPPKGIYVIIPFI